MRAAERWGDLVRDVVVELSARRSRSLLMLAAVALSTGALVASVGVSTTAAHQIGADLAASTLDQVTVSVAQGAADAEGGGSAEGGAPDAPAGVFPADTEARATAVQGVVAAGRRLDLSGHGPDTVAPAAVPSGTAAGGDADAIRHLTVAGVVPGYLDAAHDTVDTGRAWLLGTDQTVAFLGVEAAKVLGIPVTTDPTGYAISVGGTTYRVAGFARTEDGGADVSGTVLLPYARVLAVVGSDGDAQLLVRTAPGAGAGVAGVIRVAVRPDAPERLAASQVESLASLRHGVSNQLGRLSAWIGAFLLALTALLIANAMVVAVVARTPEIGLRRALGASRSAVSAVFWCEGAVTGFLGGVAGSAFGLAATVAVAAANDWSARLAPWLAAVGPVLGAVVGVAASAYPALRAGRVSPALAIRAD
ncbi:ABC transporter permease [Luteimicrobium sp. DT211]|uniref:ABC transporter permease n=1 Tax=Luteimicrobium sp. DT211 TaxID=3393412 RepID=UPI003CEDBD7C